MQEQFMDSITDVMPVEITGDGRRMWDGTGGARLVASPEWLDSWQTQGEGEMLWKASALNTDYEENKN